MLRVGVVETVTVSVFDVNGDVDIQLSLQDYPHRRRTFSQVSGKFRKRMSIEMHRRYKTVNANNQFCVNPLRFLNCLTFIFVTHSFAYDVCF